MKDEVQSRIETGCRQPNAHADHLCRLMEAGQTAAVRAAAENAAYVCGNCGAHAADPARLCNPQPLAD